MLTAKVKTTLQIAKVQTLKSKIAKSDSDRFKASVELSSIIYKADLYLDTKAGKLVIKSESTKEDKMNKEKFIRLHFNLSKQWWSYLQRAGKAIEAKPSIVDEYLKACDELEANGGTAGRDIKKLTEFYNDSLTSKSGAKPAPKKSTAAAPKAAPKKSTADIVGKSKDVLTLAFAGASLKLSNVSVRIGSDGQFKTSNSAVEIGKAISYLLQALKGSGLMNLEAPVVEAGNAAAKKKADKKAQEVKELHEFFTTNSGE
jgi:hypothetical protein